MFDLNDYNNQTTSFPNTFHLDYVIILVSEGPTRCVSSSKADSMWWFGGRRTERVDYKLQSLTETRKTDTRIKDLRNVLTGIDIMGSNLS